MLGGRLLLLLLWVPTQIMGVPMPPWGVPHGSSVWVLGGRLLLLFLLLLWVPTQIMGVPMPPRSGSSVWVLSAQIAWCTRHPQGGSSVQALKASSISFRVITGMGTTFSLSQHVGGRRLCLKVFVWVLG